MSRKSELNSEKETLRKGRYGSNPVPNRETRPEGDLRHDGPVTVNSGTDH